MDIYRTNKHYKLLIEPVRNWNKLSNEINMMRLWSSNWTCKELKHAISCINIAPEQASNWTCKELKQETKSYLLLSVVLLIEPVRNWNYVSSNRGSGRNSSNWTCKELKRGSLMEGWRSLRLLIEPVRNWNYIKDSDIIGTGELLIEPVRNWNDRKYWPEDGPKNF